MADQPRDQIVSWLNDAYAMEQSITQVLENHVKDAEDHPQLQARLQQHLTETKHHAELVKGCIERLGGGTSSIKAGMSSMMGRVQGMSTGAASDELVKDGISDFSTEYFEIASYKALIAAANSVGDTETVQICREILRDEESMAAFLDQHLPMVVQETLQGEIQASD